MYSKLCQTWVIPNPGLNPDAQAKLQTNLDIL